MSYGRKSRGNKNALKLLKQAIYSSIEFKLYNVSVIRYKSYNKTVYPMQQWDRPNRNNFIVKNWKEYRKNQWK